MFLLVTIWSYPVLKYVCTVSQTLSILTVWPWLFVRKLRVCYFIFFFPWIYFCEALNSVGRRVVPSVFFKVVAHIFGRYSFYRIELQSWTKQTRTIKYSVWEFGRQHIFVILAPCSYVLVQKWIKLWAFSVDFSALIWRCVHQTLSDTKFHLSTSCVTFPNRQTSP